MNINGKLARVTIYLTWGLGLVVLGDAAVWALVDLVDDAGIFWEVCLW